MEWTFENDWTPPPETEWNYPNYEWDIPENDWN